MVKIHWIKELTDMTLLASDLTRKRTPPKSIPDLLDRRGEEHRVEDWLRCGILGEEWLMKQGVELKDDVFRAKWCL